MIKTLFLVASVLSVNAQITKAPTGAPSTVPSGQPSGVPSGQPVSTPTAVPSSQPSSAVPTQQPSSSVPTSNAPTSQPSSTAPSGQPTTMPSSAPTYTAETWGQISWDKARHRKGGLCENSCSGHGLCEYNITAPATLGLTARPNGLALTAHCAPAPRTTLGLVASLARMIFTLGWSALTRVLATASPAPANALLVTKELPARDQSALTTATSMAPAGPRSTLPLRMPVFTPLLGTG
jgi:hypothetical protein